jgi:hypothetical protein
MKKEGIMRLLLCAVWVLSFGLIGAAAQAANVTLSPVSAEQGYRFVHVTGEIIGGDAEQLEQALLQAQGQNNQIAVMLDSRGGDVDVSMAMGQFIRRYHAVTYHAYCASACVFAFLGGEQRYFSQDSGAMLNVHRPELAEAHIAHPTAFTTRMLEVLRTYIASMTGSSSLYNAMMFIPFSSPRALLPSEAQSMQVATAVLP